MAAATQLRISTDANTGIQLDLHSLFASIDDALGDAGKR
jgi:hypothetical protein